ncbi:PAS domain S-box protein [Haloterrigena sp. H1]|uniref:PAS domain-containing sensor histidine kinase n=1 Tax=Haloterrigena sp. H1 TaxID=2552943 RepID=UPI00110E1754|nr:PAS domain S-box protein [Haloterrigena sp. H1]TMT86618.1 PAS domain S-box protein [Haloterrigena sp. H1]
MSDVAGVSTELFRSEESDSDSLRRCRTLVNAIDDGIFQLNAEGRFVAINDAIVSLTGYPRADLLGEHVSTVVSAPDAKRLEDAIRTRLEEDVDPDTPFNLVVETAAGERISCELRVSLLVANGELEGAVGVVRAVDDHDPTNEQLPSVWTASDSIASVIDEANVGVFVLDDAFDIVWADETIEEYFGLERAEIIGRDKPTLIRETIRDRLADPETFAQTVLATYEDNTSVEQFECRVTAGTDRKERWLEHRSKPIESGPYAGGRIELYYDITDRKEAQQARQESEKRFQSIVDAVDEYAIFMLDPDGYVRSWNEGAKRIKGYSATEIIGEHFSTFYTEADREDDIPERNLTHARETGTVEGEGWRVRSDGSRFWASVTITAIYDEGELQGYAKITRDMTDRREREQRLRHEYELSERILETSPVGIAVVNRDGSTARANERMAELLDLPSDDESVYTTAQRDMYDTNGEFIPIEERPVPRVFETGTPVTDREIRLNRPDGQQWLSVNVRPITDEQGEPEQVVETATDITDLKELAQRRKRELEEREKELDAVQLATNLLETADQPASDLLQEFVTSLPQFFRYPNRTAVCVSVGDHEVVTDTYEPLEQRITASSSTANGTPIAIDIVLHDDPDLAADDAAGFSDEEADLLETLATLLKLHFDRREYIEELQASNGRLEQFAYAASHDLQEPLRMVTSYLQLIETRYGEALDEDGEEFLDYAVDGAERMREMIDGLLEYSRVETRGDPFEAVDLETVLSDVLADLQFSIEEHDAEITAESLPTVVGDASQLRQVFQNLLDNAIEYSGDEPPRVHVAAERTGDEWTISIRDDGIGIAPDDEERVFEVFQRLHTNEEHAGTGIGLALCRRIVERHDGEIWVDSEPGEGTTVSFTLPATDS